MKASIGTEYKVGRPFRNVVHELVTAAAEQLKAREIAPLGPEKVIVLVVQLGAAAPTRTPLRQRREAIQAADGLPVL